MVILFLSMTRATRSQNPNVKLFFILQQMEAKVNKTRDN